MARKGKGHPSTTTGQLRRPFDEQVKFFRGKLGNLVPTARWDDLQRAAHDRAFMVAGATKEDLLTDLAQAVERAIGEGKSLGAFRKEFRGIVETRGWHGWTGEGTRHGELWRTRTIYTTNMRTSYSAGRLAQLRDPELQERAPLWMYQHGGSADPRPEHLAWDGLTLPADDPWWQTHYPPNGWGCSCYVVAVSAAQAERLGGRREAPPPVDPAGAIDPGWDYMPGATAGGQ